MAGNLFATCFLACLFSFAIFGVAAWQISAYLIRRALAKNLPEILSKAVHSYTGMLHGNPDREVIEELERAAAQTPIGMVPHLPVVKCECGFAVDVPHTIDLKPFLEERGWKCEKRFNGWGCPVCVLKRHGEGTVG